MDQQHLATIPSTPTLGTATVTVPEGVFDKISKLVKRIKANANYTEAMGNDLVIIAPTQPLTLLLFNPI